MDQLIEHPAQAHRLDPEARRLRANVRGLMEGGVGVAVGVTVETRDAEALHVGLAVVGLVELLLRERREQQAHAFHLDRRQDAVQDCEVVPDREQLPARDIAQLRPGAEEHGWRKLRKQMVRQIEVGVEPFERPPFLLGDLRDLEFRKDHATGGVLDVRQGQEPLRKEILVPNLVGGHGGQLLPGQARRHLDPHPLLDRPPSPGHHHAWSGAVAQVVAFGEQRFLALHHSGLGRLVIRPNLGEVLLDHREVRLARRGLGLGRLGRAQAIQQQCSAQPAQSGPSKYCDPSVHGSSST